VPESGIDRAEDGPEARLAAVESTISRLEAVVAGNAAWMADLQRDLVAGPGTNADLAAGLASHTEWLGTLERWVSSCVKILANFGAQPLDTPTPSASGSLDVFGTLMTRLEVPTVMAWIADAAEVVEGPLISVDIATRNRPKWLRKAIGSVLAQSYTRFEIVVADDSDGEETARVLETIDDDRIRVVRTPTRGGGAAAFNTALEGSTGDIITFLDDDNLMHPEWLRSIVWAFSSFPDLEALYGARINEDAGAEHGNRSGMLPTLEFARYDRSRHEQANFIDRNTMAFRSRHSDLRYDTSLGGAIDWDHSLRLFARTPPMALPVVACYYRTVIPGRISDSPDKLDGFHQVHARAHTTRPMRVHVHTAMYPVMSETYIGEDIGSLRAAGAAVTLSAVQEAVSRTDDAPSCSLDADGVIGEADPDIVLLHWATHAQGSLPMIEQHGIPFVCRVHSFDFDPGLVAQLFDHPLCAAVIAYDHQLDRLPDGVQGLAPSIGPDLVIPLSPVERSGVLSASAGLPKKDFPLLIEAMAQLPPMPKAIIIAASNGFEEVPAQVVASAESKDRSITVSVNVPRDQVLEAMARTSVFVYTVAPDVPMGVPMSIIEAMLCGAVIIGPDRPEIHRLVGEELRVYTTAADIARHVEDVARGGPSVEAARAAIRQRAEQYRNPAQREQLHRIMSESLTDWKLRQS
jgi:glycosyltransferase involved in cell wall biosynthesis